MTLFYISSVLALLLAGFVLSLKPCRAAPAFFAAFLLVLALLNGLTAAFGPAAPQLVSSVKIGLSAALPILLHLHLRCLLRRPARLGPFTVGQAMVPVFVVGAFDLGLTSAVLPGDSLLFAVWFLFALLGLRETFMAHRAPDRRPKPAILVWAWLLVAWLASVSVADLFIAQMAVAGPVPESSVIFMAAGTLVLASVAAMLFATLHRSDLLGWLLDRPPVRVLRPDNLIDRLETELRDSRVFLDPNLTLQRFSKMVGQPQRAVADEINEARGRNFRSWLNGFRIAEAKRLLMESPERPVTEILFEAGFQTKSTFNAAFKAETGLSPSAWRTEAV